MADLGTLIARVTRIPVAWLQDLNDWAYRTGRVYASGNALDDAAKIQTEINAAPAGGKITLRPNVDYSAVSGVTNPTEKVLTVDGRGTTPPPTLADQTGVAVLKSGNFDVQYSTLGSAKPGNYWNFLSFGTGISSDTGNQVSAAYHVDGIYENQADHAGQSFFHAYSFNLTTRETTANMGEVRGMKGTIKGDGGNTTLRAIHVTAEGLNGHTGVIRGVFATADRVDQPDGVFVSGSQAASVGAQVGAGCLAAVIAEAARVPQKPSYAFVVARTGSTRIEPETACYEAHGAGNGAMYRGVRNATSGDVIYAVDNKARQMARSYYSGRTTINDDATATLTLNAQSGQAGVLMFWTNNSQVWGLFFYRATGTPVAQQMALGTSCAITTATDLTGTTGVDGQLTVSVKDTGEIEIENRIGSATQFNWMLFHNSENLGNLA